MKPLATTNQEIWRPTPSGRCSVFCLALALATLIAFPGCSGQKVQSRGVAQEVVPVRVAAAVQKTVPVEVPAIGNVEAYSTVSVKSQVGGALERAYFKEGDEVKAGDPLFTIDPRPFEAALKQAQANLARDTAEARNARAEAERYTKLLEEGVISQQQYDQAHTNAEALEAAVRADTAAVENAKLQLEYCSIRSPIDGRTGSLMLHPGNVVKANDIALVAINQVTPLYVSFAVPEQYLSPVKKYMAMGALKVDVLFPDDQQRPTQGALTFVDNAVDTTTGTIRLKATFPNKDRRLWPGQFVQVKLRLTEEPNVVVVPSQAVQTGQEGQYVFVVKSDLTAEARPVVVGRTLDGETVVERGLLPGETVVTDGHLRLVPGAKVEVKTELEPTSGRNV